MTPPKATRWLSYPGDVRHIVGEVKGPNMLGEHVTAVVADYDAEANMTRVGYAYGVHRVAAGIRHELDTRARESDERTVTP